MTKEEIALQETMGIFEEHELGITGLANAMDIYAKQQGIALWTSFGTITTHVLCSTRRY